MCAYHSEACTRTLYHNEHYLGGQLSLRLPASHTDEQAVERIGQKLGDGAYPVMHLVACAKAEDPLDITLMFGSLSVGPDEHGLLEADNEPRTLLSQARYQGQRLTEISVGHDAAWTILGMLQANAGHEHYGFPSCEVLIGLCKVYR